MKKEVLIHVEVFRTDVANSTDADICTLVLSHHFPHTRIDFDLEDSDRILRVEGWNIDADKITTVLASLDISCTPLEG